MHSLLRIFRRYIITACFITLLILFLNIAVYSYFAIHYSRYSADTRKVGKISKELTFKSDHINLSGHGLKMLKSEFSWAMLLDDDGDVLWNWNLPKDIPTSYTSTQIASFSRWYLNGYPVQVWENDHGLFVAGGPRDSIWKLELIVPQAVMREIPDYFVMVLVGNIILIVLLSVLFGYRFYRSLRPVAKGIEQLSRQEQISLPEKGITAELSSKLNQTSAILETQNTSLSKRDTARTNWISGISHDIRTPLSMVMGYAENLESDSSLNSEQRQQASVIKNQSIKIKKLIENLNLTSKLEYNMQPLKVVLYSPATHLREIIASYYNNGLPETYSINLEIEQEVETLNLQGDTDLLARAYSNIIDNSIHHNEKGCSIGVKASGNCGSLTIQFTDDGKGIPAVVTDAVLNDKETGEKQPHIMGLRIIKQIIHAHSGVFDINKERKKGSEIIISYPVKG